MSHSLKENEKRASNVISPLANPTHHACSVVLMELQENRPRKKAMRDPSFLLLYLRQNNMKGDFDTQPTKARSINQNYEENVFFSCKRPTHSRFLF